MLKFIRARSPFLLVRQKVIQMNKSILILKSCWKEYRALEGVIAKKIDERLRDQIKEWAEKQHEEDLARQLSEKEEKQQGGQRRSKKIKSAAAIG